MNINTDSFQLRELWSVFLEIIELWSIRSTSHSQSGQFCFSRTVLNVIQISVVFELFLISSLNMNLHFSKYFLSLVKNQFRGSWFCIQDWVSSEVVFSRLWKWEIWVDPKVVIIQRRSIEPCLAFGGYNGQSDCALIVLFIFVTSFLKANISTAAAVQQTLESFSPISFSGLDRGLPVVSLNVPLSRLRFLSSRANPSLVDWHWTSTERIVA